MNLLPNLLPEDEEYLNSTYPGQWEWVWDSPEKVGMLIRDFPIPDGYTVSAATLMLLIPSGYPGSMLDMFYFLQPGLEKTSRQPIAALATEKHFGRSWQRWSRHYKWEPSRDSVASHIEYVKNELGTELSR